MEKPLKADMIVGNDWHTGPIAAMTRLLTPCKKAMGDLDPQTADKIENIPIITITPIAPIAFFKIEAHPITVSVASPSIFPTTGIKLDTTAFAVFAVTPSTLLLKFPSIETKLTNNVKIVPSIHTVPDLKNFESLFNCA